METTGILSLNPTELLLEASKIHGQLQRQCEILADIKEEYMLSCAAIDAEYSELYAYYHKDLEKPTKDLILAYVKKDKKYTNIIKEKISKEKEVNKQKAIVEAIQTKSKMINAMLYPLSEEYKQGVRHTSMLKDVPGDYTLED